MAGGLTERDRGARGDSPLHRMDPRVKLLLALSLIVYAVSLGERGSPPPLHDFLVLEASVLLGLAVSGIPLRRFGRRLLVLFPFAAPLVLLQPFVVPGAGPSLLFLQLSTEGVEFAALLGSRVLVAASTAILLSMVTPLEEVSWALRSLRVPGEFVSMLELFVRQLFVIAEIASSTLRSARSRGFPGETGYREHLRSVGSVMGTVTARAFERGDDVYLAMASRGYGPGSRFPGVESSVGWLDAAAVLVVAAAITVSILFV